MKVFVAWLFGFGLSACGGPYDDLEQKYGADIEPSDSVLSQQTVVMTSTRHRGAYNLQRIVNISLAPDYVAVSTEFPFSLAYDSLRIPLHAINGCGKTCFGNGNFDADLLLGGDGIEVSVDRSSEVLEWCWEVGLPMITGKNKRDWMYKGDALPSREGYVQVSREEYARQTKSRCMGY